MQSFPFPWPLLHQFRSCCDFTSLPFGLHINMWLKLNFQLTYVWFQLMYFNLNSSFSPKWLLTTFLTGAKEFFPVDPPGVQPIISFLYSRAHIQPLWRLLKTKNEFSLIHRRSPQFSWFHFISGRDSNRMVSSCHEKHNQRVKATRPRWSVPCQIRSNTISADGNRLRISLQFYRYIYLYQHCKIF